MTTTRNIVGRLAPSPTGLLHLGHARSFLLAYWSVRQQGGRLVLRLEDLDDERSTDEHVDNTLRDLEWLGLDWDGKPRRQSEHRDQLVEAARELARRGLAYPCTCTRSDLRAAVAAPQEGGGTELRYAGRCRGRYASVEQAEQVSACPPSLRFKVRDGVVRVDDDFVGQVNFDVTKDCGDFLILRRNQVPSYQLAVVVDDIADGINEVVRGEDLLASAARQQLLYEAFRVRPPRWKHVPLVIDERGQRFAKRTDALSLSALRAAGIDARLVVGWVARHSGWPEAECIAAAELTSSFSWSRVPQSRVTFSVTDCLEIELRH